MADIEAATMRMTVAQCPLGHVHLSIVEHTLPAAPDLYALPSTVRVCPTCGIVFEPRPMLLAATPAAEAKTGASPCNER